MCVGADIEDAIDFLKQMNGSIQEGDIKGAEHFLDKVNLCLDQIEDGLAESQKERLYDEA
jgi:flagellin-specific chaperone FliS